jgi:tRNA (guanine-N7-)-methyltransferase
MHHQTPKLSSRTLPWPTDWAGLFGASRPLIVEIGFGYGAFLLHLARAHPEASIIGFEIANRCLNHVERQVNRLKLEHVRLIHSTAETALHHLFTPASISALHINFPDPWFKTRHGHRRLMQRDTLDAVVSRLIPGADFLLATDILAYAEMSAALLAATPGLDNQLAAAWVHHLPGRVVTKYEGKALREGRPCYYFHYRRNLQPPPLVPTIREFVMPHVVFQSPLSLDALFHLFIPGQHRPEEGIVVSLLHAYRGQDALLLEVFIKEPTIDQHVAFTISPRRDAANEYTLQLSTLGYPRSTRGLHAAAAVLSQWLLGLHPQTVVVKQSLSEPD